jgi:RNA polymerase sigma-70 factor (ECF subfamily)
MELSSAAALYSGRSAAQEHALEAAPSFSRVYDEHVDFVWRSVRRLGVSEAAADDVVQQAFLVVHRRLADFERRSSMKTWIFSIVLRVVRDHRRSIRRKSPHWLQAGEPPDPEMVPDAAARGPHEALARAEASRLLEQLLDTLDDDKRAVFVLAELEQMQPAEIAEATGEHVKTVYSRLRAARADFEAAAARLRKRDEWRFR